MPLKFETNRHTLINRKCDASLIREYFSRIFLSTLKTEAANLQLVVAGVKVVLSRQTGELRFECTVFGQGRDGAAVQTRQVMVVVLKGIAQLQFIFPTDLQALHNPQLLKQSDGSVDAGPVNSGPAAVNELLHGLWLAASQGLVDGVARRSDVPVAGFERPLEGWATISHVANVA